MYQIAVFTGSDSAENGTIPASADAQHTVNAWLAQHPAITITHMTSAVNINKDILITIMYQDHSAPQAQPLANSGVWTNR